MKSESAAPSATRDDVERLYGQCVLRLQAFELKLKAIVATHQVSGTIDTFEANRARRNAETRRKTMGALVGEMMGSVLVPFGQEGPPEADEAATETCVTISRRIALPAEAYSRIEAEHRDLVALRNSLVHHFLEEHDLHTEHGCLVAGQALTSLIERVTRAEEGLGAWAIDMERAATLLIEKLDAPEIRDWIAGGKIPWSITTIVQALQDAATEMAQGGWASVESAATLVLSRLPDERPENYGCRSWRQVIHESGLFTLRIMKVDGRRRAFYRPRTLGV